MVAPGTRKVVDGEFLADILISHLKQVLEAHDGINVTIQWQEPDAAGANWTVPFVNVGGAPGEAYLGPLTQKVRELQAQYTLLHLNAVEVLKGWAMMNDDIHAIWVIGGHAEGKSVDPYRADIAVQLRAGVEASVLADKADQWRADVANKAFIAIGKIVPIEEAAGGPHVLLAARR